LILDGHDSHITLEAIKQAQEFGLNMVTFPSHTSHALLPLDVSCFKSFKIVFKKEQDATMARNINNELDKITRVGWVDKALDQLLTKHNIKFGFKGSGIWPFNPKAMENKTQQTSIYIIGNSNGDQGSEDQYSSNDQVGHSHIKEKESTATELFNIVKVVGPLTTEYNHVEHKHQYYVEMPHSPCVIDDAEVAHLPINLIDPNPNL
jgi:hypothetical protein